VWTRRGPLAHADVHGSRLVRVMAPKCGRTGAGGLIAGQLGQVVGWDGPRVLGQTADWRPAGTVGSRGAPVSR
jgi:hypothetical protein